MPAAVEEKSMVPTVLVGIGGTGNEILSRLRRLIEESYGSLSNFPIVSVFWWLTRIRIIKSVILKLLAVLLKITKNTGPG